MTEFRKLNGVETSATHPGAVSILTPLGNVITATLREPDVHRFTKLLARVIVRDDDAR